MLGRGGVTVPLGTEALRDPWAQRTTGRNCSSLCLLSHVLTSQGSTMNFTEWLVLPCTTRRILLFLALTFLFPLVLVGFEGTWATWKPKVSEKLAQSQGYFCAIPPLCGQSLSRHMPANSPGNPAPRAWEQLWFFPLTASSELHPPAATSLAGINPDIEHLALLYLQRGVVLALPPLPQLRSLWWFYLHFYLLQTPGSFLYFPSQQRCYQCQIFQAVRTLLNRNSLKPLTGSLKVKHLTVLHWG